MVSFSYCRPARQRISENICHNDIRSLGRDKMNSRGGSAIDERIRFEVEQQTRSLLHHAKATNATIRKCVSRKIGEKLQKAVVESANPAPNKNDFSSRNSDKNATANLDAHNSAIHSEILQDHRTRKQRPTSPFELLSSKDQDASRFIYREAPVSSPAIDESPDELLAHVRGTNRTLRKTQSEIFPHYERLYRTRKESKIVAEVSHASLYVPPEKKQAKVRKLRLEKLRKREVREEAKLTAQLLGASASMISFQSLREKVRKDKSEQAGEKLRRVELFKRNQRYVKRRLKILRNKQKKDKKMSITRDKRIVNKLLKKNKRKEEKRLLVARSKTHMLERTSKGSYELVDVVNPKNGLLKYKKFIPKCGMRGGVNSNRQKLQAPSSTICIDGFVLFSSEEAAAHMENSSENRVVGVANTLSYDEMFNPSTANLSDLNEESSQMYGPYQPWGGLTPIATPNSGKSSYSGQAVTIPSVSGAFLIGNETLSGKIPMVDSNQSVDDGELQMPSSEGWKPLGESRQTLEWGRATSANNMISNGSLSRSSISSQGSSEIPLRMDVSSPFNARRHYAKTTLKPLSPAFRSTSSRDSSSMHDTVIGNLPAPWGQVKEEHMVGRGPIFTDV